MEEAKDSETSFKRLKEKLKTIDFKNLHTRLALSGMAILIVLALGLGGYKLNRIRTKAFDVYLGEEKIGTIRDEEKAINIAADLKDELCKAYDMDISLKDEISFENTHVRDKYLTPKEELEKNIRSKMNYLVYGYVLKVNGEEVVAAKTEEEIEDAINKIKGSYEENIEENKVLKEVEIIENLKIIKKEMPINEIIQGEDLHTVLLTGSEEIKTHVVEVGESLSTIAYFYDLSLEDLIDANPGRDPDVLQIGDEIKLVMPKSAFTVATVSEMEYTEEIKYETEIEYDDNMYNTQKNTKVAGANGSAKILAKEIKHNGRFVGTEIVKEEILEAPVKEILVQGTKEPPKTMATGTFLMPTRGRISSRYGMRNGRMHKGLDIASGTGTDIKAADGGKVIFTGYRGAYGNLVEIDHENGYRTRYAHNSKILVNTGDRVYKGEVIAKMGSTGRSTGSHLHFEVIENGSHKNPSGYVN